MEINFYKYQGTGNDFVIIDNRDGKIALSTEQVAGICHRRFGIGADGLMLLETEPGYDFRMVYYNADGNESTMCGNGGRCIAAFAKRLGIITSGTSFMAVDGPHKAEIDEHDFVSLQMSDVKTIRFFDDHVILDTGSPHYIKWVDDVAHEDVFTNGRAIRTQAAFQPKGINVNFVQKEGPQELSVRTYERGVEDETLSCGTGVTAAAIAAAGASTGAFAIAIKTPGGDLKVTFDKNDAGQATNVWLHGKAEMVYEGRIVKK